MKLVRNLLIFASLLLASCQDVIDVDLPEGETFLVVNGTVDDSLGTELILSTSAGYFEQGETPPINNAQVFLYEDGNMVARLEREITEEGKYTSDFTGEIGRNYYIEIDIPANEPNFRESTWRSSPAEMKRVFAIDSMNVRRLNRFTNPRAFEAGNYAVAYFQEPEGLGDRYRFTRWLNDSVFRRNIFLLPDIGVDGFYFGDPEAFGGFEIYGPLEEGDSVRVQISSLTKDHYNYLDLLGEQVFQVGSTFDPPPAPLYGNVYNVDDEEEVGFGYFGASAISGAGLVYNP